MERESCKSVCAELYKKESGIANDKIARLPKTHCYEPKAKTSVRSCISPDSIRGGCAEENAELLKIDGVWGI